MNSIDFYNKMSAKFLLNLTNGRMLSFNPGIYRRIFDDINSKLNFKQTDFVLDLGGGTGLITQHIGQNCAKIELADGAELVLTTAKKKLSRLDNVLYGLVDIEKKLPYKENFFDKILCYSVVHCLSDYKYFIDLLEELVRIVKPNGGAILIGDIPLDEKYKFNLENRKKYPLKNFLLNQKYYIKKFITRLFYRLNNLADVPKNNIYFTRERIINELKKIDGINYRFLEQNEQLPCANSREDLLIIKL